MTTYRKVLLLLCLPALCIFSCKEAGDAVVEELLKKEAKKFNEKKGGMMIDDQTRLDSFNVQPGRTLTYHYTLVRFGREEVDTAVMKKYAEPEIKKGVRTNEQLKMLREHDVRFLYIYHDKKGKYVLSIAVNPADYKQAH